MLGALLATVLEGVDARGIGGARAGNAVLAATEEALLCPLTARLWMVLHWLLATEPLHRPSSRRLVEMIHSLCEWGPQDLLIEMPEYARFHCQGMAAAAARRLAFAGLSSAGMVNRSCVAGLPLDVLRQSLADPGDVDQLCENCGLELDEYSGKEDDAVAAPSLIPVLATPCPVDITIELKIEETLSSPKLYSASDPTDESTDAGSASGDESSVCESNSGARRRFASLTLDDFGACSDRCSSP
jgi:hypothetical protein